MTRREQKFALETHIFEIRNKKWQPTHFVTTMTTMRHQMISPETDAKFASGRVLAWSPQIRVVVMNRLDAALKWRNGEWRARE